jgi:hypothetical protein
VIYDRPIWALMQDAAAELSPPYTVGEIIAWFAQHLPEDQGKFGTCAHQGPDRE